MFFVYAANESGGGHVACSDEFFLGEQLEGLPLILGLLTDWVCRSDINGSLTSHFRWIMPLNTINNSLHTNKNDYYDFSLVLFVLWW